MRVFYRPVLVVAGVLSLIVGYIMYFMYSLSASVDDFSLRHLEASTTIEQTYTYFHKNGKWPSEGAFGIAGLQPLPFSWEYSYNSNLSTPMLFLDGPSHMAMVYRFEIPKGEHPSQTWVLSIEGSKRTFQADVPYSVD